MQKESLLQIVDSLSDTIMNSNIKPEDKIELLINLKYFLDPKDYKENITVLRRNQDKKTYRERI